MPRMSSQQHTHSHTQNHSTYHSGYAQGPSTARVHNYIPPQCYTQLVTRTPHYDPQPLTQDNFRNMTSTQFQRGNGANWGDSMTGLNYETNEALGTDAPPLLNGGEYAPPQFQYGNFDPAGTNYTGFPFVSEPLPNLGRNIPHSFLETNAVPSNHGASPVWNLSNCWVGYETQDELHLTTVFRKAPFT